MVDDDKLRRRPPNAHMLKCSLASFFFLLSSFFFVLCLLASLFSLVHPVPTFFAFPHVTSHSNVSIVYGIVESVGCSSSSCHLSLQRKWCVLCGVLSVVCSLWCALCGVHTLLDVLTSVVAGWWHCTDSLSLVALSLSRCSLSLVALSLYSTLPLRHKSTSTPFNACN